MFVLKHAGAPACLIMYACGYGSRPSPGRHRNLRRELAPQRSAAVRITNDFVSSRAVAEPVKRSVTRPSVGSSEKVIATIACGFTKCCRIAVRSASPNTVTDIELLALGASMITRSQISSLPLEAARRAEAAKTSAWPCAPLATTVVTSLTAIELRDGAAGRALRGIGALAETTLVRSTGATAAGA